LTTIFLGTIALAVVLLGCAPNLLVGALRDSAAALAKQ